MELPADLSPATEYATSAVVLPRPTLTRNLSFWLLAMLLGLVLLLLFILLTANGRAKDSFGFLSLTACLATVLSLVVLPLLLLLLPWALTAPAVGLRWLRVFTLQSLSLGGLTTLGYKLDVSGSDHGGFSATVSTIYFVAGLLVAIAVYWPWLRRSR